MPERSGGTESAGAMPVVERSNVPGQTRYYDDKEWFAIDTSGGPFDGTLYAAWIRVDDPVPTAPVSQIFSKSTDGGRTWSKEKVISAGGGSQVAIGPDGEIYISYVELTATRRQRLLLVSTDGGETFGAPLPMGQFTGPGGLIPNLDVPVYGYHTFAVDLSERATRGNLYMTFPGAADPNGPLTGQLPASVYVMRSTDRGRTWSAPQRLSADVAIKRDALMPSIAVDRATGDVVVAWLDRRDDPANTLARVYATRSIDGGARSPRR